MDTPLPEVEIKGALERACAALLKYQAADGHFDGDIDQGTAATAQTMIVEKHLGVLQAEDAADGVRWLCGRIREDGSIPAYPGASFPSLSEAGCAYGAMAAAGLPEHDPRRRRVRSWLESRGGLLATDPITQLYLALAGVLPADSLPLARLEHVLIPGVEHYLAQRFNAYYGMAFGYLLPGLLHGLRTQSGGGRPGLVAQAARGRIIDYLLARQNPEGNWLGSQWATCLALACLSVLGIPRSHDAIERGLQSLGRMKRRDSAGLRVTPINAGVWNTAMALRVLKRAGHAQVAGPLAVEYLLSVQSTLSGPREWTNLPAGAPRTGGWSFEVGNLNLLDTDTTAMVLMALADHAQQEPVRAAIRRGEQWLCSLQNDDGGFPAYTRGQLTASPGPLFARVPEVPRSGRDMARFFWRPPLEFGDMSTADLTARVLSSLARLGHAKSAPEMAQAIRFLYAQRDGDAWWGRWTTNYLAATAFVLQALCAAGESPRSEPAQLALLYLLRHQNDDGGFGECNESYSNPGLAGIGPSNAYLTGLVLLALCAVRKRDSRAAARAVGFLCKSQREDGLWEEFQAVQSVAPPEMFYKNFVNFQTAPLEALAVYLQSKT